MALLCVTYDLSKPGQDYEDLIKKLKSYPQWCKPLYSTWFIVTPQTPSQVVDELAPFLDKNDKVMAFRVGSNAAWNSLSTEVSTWIKENWKAS